MNNPFQYSLTTRPKEKAINALLSPEKDEKILDLGCGLGYYADKITAKGSVCYGVDIDYNSLALAKHNTSAFFIQAASESIPIADNSVDKVLFTDVIEHLKDDGVALKEIARVLKDKGVVVITTASKEGFFCGTRLNMLFHDKVGSPEYHYRVGYSTEELVCRMQRYGIRVQEVKYCSVFLGEIFIELLKLFYSFIKKDFNTQADTIKVNDSLLFTVYKKVFFPFLLFISEKETELFSERYKGHIVIVKGILDK